MTDEVINNDGPDLDALMRDELDREAAERKLVVAFIDTESEPGSDLRSFLSWLRGRIGDEVLARGVEYATVERRVQADDYMPGDRVRYRSYLADGGIGTIDYIDPDDTLYVLWDDGGLRHEVARDIKPADDYGARIKRAQAAWDRAYYNR